MFFWRLGSVSCLIPLPSSSLLSWTWSNYSTLTLLRSLNPAFDFCSNCISPPASLGRVVHSSHLKTHSALSYCIPSSITVQNGPFLPSQNTLCPQLQYPLQHLWAEWSIPPISKHTLSSAIVITSFGEPRTSLTIPSWPLFMEILHQSKQTSKQKQTTTKAQITDAGHDMVDYQTCHPPFIRLDLLQDLELWIKFNVTQDIHVENHADTCFPWFWVYACNS